MKTLILAKEERIFEMFFAYLINFLIREKMKFIKIKQEKILFNF